MNTDEASALERRIATLLGVGTWLASLVIAVGLAIPTAAPLVKAGVALFIALPIARVVLMLVAFLRHRDYRIGIVSALVLIIILLGIVLGARMSGQESLAKRPPNRNVMMVANSRRNPSPGAPRSAGEMPQPWAPYL